MVKPTRLSEKIMFRTTAEDHRRLVERAKREHRSLANLIYMLVRAGMEQGEVSQPVCTETRINGVQS
jgi:hypothetical protein